MGGLSSPTGYLDLDQSMITGADQTGTGTVDGVPVTIYTISIAPAQGENIPGLNCGAGESDRRLDAILKQQGFTGSTVQVSIDASGYIRQTRSVAHFSDGSTTSSESTFSDFGCAGTVLMPGQTGGTAPPAGCVSPDTGVAPTTTTTSTAPPIHDCAVDDTAADTDDRDRAAELDDLYDHRGPIDHDDHRPRSDDDDNGLSAGLAQTRREQRPTWSRATKCMGGRVRPRDGP